jgi:hypothetical protein
LQSPCKSDGTDNGSGSGHGEESRDIAVTKARLTIGAAPHHRRDNRSAHVEKSRCRESANLTTESLYQWRADTEKDGSGKRKRGALCRWPGGPVGRSHTRPIIGAAPTVTELVNSAALGALAACKSTRSSK